MECLCKVCVNMYIWVERKKLPINSFPELPTIFIWEHHVLQFYLLLIPPSGPLSASSPSPTQCYLKGNNQNFSKNINPGLPKLFSASGPWFAPPPSTYNYVGCNQWIQVPLLIAKQVITNIIKECLCNVCVNIWVQRKKSTWLPQRILSKNFPPSPS